VVDCPACGASTDGAAPRGARGDEEERDLLSRFIGFFTDSLVQLRELVRLLTPPRPVFYRQWSTTLNNLPNTLVAGNLYLSLTESIPPNCRGWLLRNLSPTKTVQYYYSKDRSAPEGGVAIQTLPASSAIAQDENPGELSLLIDNSASDASVEVKFLA